MDSVLEGEEKNVAAIVGADFMKIIWKQAITGNITKKNWALRSGFLLPNLNVSEVLPL